MTCKHSKGAACGLCVEWAQLRQLVAWGHPRPYIERYFKIQPDRSDQAMVPMLFEAEPNQVYYYDQLFGERRRWLRQVLDEGKNPDWDEPFPWDINVLDMKDRKARWTAFVAAVLSAKMCAVPGTHVLALVNAEDTFGTIHRFMDGFYKNMPEYARPEVRGSEWGIERKVLRFPQGDGGELTSTFTIRTAANPNVGSGETPTDLWFDEYAKFPATFSMEAQMSVRASAPSSATFWRGGTVGPLGPKCAMFEEIEQFKKGERSLTYLNRRWFDNPANILPERHRDRRPPDRIDADIVPGKDGGALCEQEIDLVPQFPDDGVPVAARLARRRAWMADAMLAAAKDPEVAYILFQREHCEDDTTPWMLAGHAQFNVGILTKQVAAAQDSTSILYMDEFIEGMRLRAWRGYDNAHVYAAGLDLGSGTGGDDSTLQILDVTTMTFMAELHGNLADPYSAVSASIRVMQRFGNGMLVIENNRFPGVGNYAKRKLGYDNTWKSPIRPGEKPEARYRRDFGMYVGAHHYSDAEPSAETLLAFFKGDFNSGAFRIANPMLLANMQLWNPNMEKHTPDRIAAARLVRLALDEARAKRPGTGAPTMKLTHPGIYQGWGRQRARPFSFTR